MKTTMCERLIAADGILSVFIEGEFHSKSNYPEVGETPLKQIAAMAKHAQTDVRAVIGDYTLNAHYLSADLVAVTSMPTGHGIAKSLRRMVSRAFKAAAPQSSKRPSSLRETDNVEEPAPATKLHRVKPVEPSPSVVTEDEAVGGVRSW